MDDTGPGPQGRSWTQAAELPDPLEDELDELVAGVEDVLLDGDALEEPLSEEPLSVDDPPEPPLSAVLVEDGLEEEEPAEDESPPLEPRLSVR